MRKFLCGFLAGAIIFGAIGGFAVTYVANTADFKVMVNGEEFTSYPPALVVEGRTYLPLRAMGEALGVPVAWNEELRRAEVGNMAAVAEKNQYSRNNPAPLDTVQTYTKTSEWFDEDNYTVSVRVMETVRGSEALKRIKEANQFNSEPDEGYEYILAKIAFSVQNVKNDGALNVSEYSFTAFSGNNEEMPKKSVVEPEPQLSGKLYAGGNTEGWITVQVKTDDKNPKLAYDIDYNGGNGIWFALQ